MQKPLSHLQIIRQNGNVLHGCETCPLEAHFQSREQPKVTRSDIQKVRRGIAAQQAMYGSVHYRDAETTVPSSNHRTKWHKWIRERYQLLALRSHRISCHTFPIISSVLDVEGLPLRWSSSNVSCPFLTHCRPVAKILAFGFQTWQTGHIILGF
jgi:hypothetical protein